MCEVFTQLGAGECRALTSVAKLQADPARTMGADLIVLDIHLGEGKPTGLDAWTWLRSKGYRGRVAFLTGHASNNPLVRSAAELSAAPVLNKPVSMQSLAALL